MKLKKLLLPITLLVLVGPAGEAEAMTAEETQKIDQIAAMICAHPSAAEIKAGEIDRAKFSVMMYAQNSKDKESTVALLEAMKRQGCG